MSSHRFHPHNGFKTQTDKPPPLGFEAQTKKYHYDFMGKINKPQLSILRLKPENPNEWF
jgi:hypothetical protein